MKLLDKLRKLAVKLAKGELPPLEYTQENVDKIKQKHRKAKLVAVPAAAVLVMAGAPPADAMPPPSRATPDCKVQYSPIHEHVSTRVPVKVRELQVYNVCTSADLSTVWSRMIRTIGVWDTTNGKNADCSDWSKVQFHVLFTETTPRHNHFWQDFTMPCENRQAKSKEVNIPDSKNINLYWGPNVDDIPIWHAYDTIAISHMLPDEDFELGGKLALFP